MATEVIAVSPELTVRELVDRLVENEISGAPVVDDERRLVGVVTLSDVARRVPERAGVDVDRSHPEFFVRGWEDRYAIEELRGMRIEDSGLAVADLMTRELFTIEEEAPVADAGRLMLESHVHRLLVTRDGELVGIVSSLDLLRAALDRA